MKANNLILLFQKKKKSGFWVIPKIASANLCKQSYDIINYCTSICLFESVNCGKDGKRVLKVEYIENKRRDWIGSEVAEILGGIFSKRSVFFHTKCPFRSIANTPKFLENALVDAYSENPNRCRFHLRLEAAQLD